MTTDYRAAIQNEIIVDDGVLYTSVRGVATLSGADKHAVQRYITSNGVGTKPVKKDVKTSQGKGRYVGTISGIAANDVATILAHFASSSKVSKDVREQSANMLVAFAARGYEAWVSDMLGVKLDNTQSNAAINTLLQQYPGATFLSDNNNVDKPVTCLEWLAWFMAQSDAGYTDDLHNWLKPRLPQAAAATYKAMVGEVPYSRIVTKHGKEVRQYFYYDVAPLMAALDQLILQWQTSLETASM